MRSSGTVSRLIRLLYEASTDAHQWTPFLESLAAETNAAGSSVLALPHAGFPIFYRHFGLESQASAPIPADPSFADDECHRTSTATGEVTIYSTATLNLIRPNSSSPFERNTTSLLRNLTPHLRQALLLHQKFARLQQDVLVLEQSLDATATACLVIDPAGHVQSLSSAAERLLAECDGITLNHGSLRAALAKEDRALEQILGERHGQLRITRRIPRKPLHVVVAPHHSGHKASSNFIVYLVDPESPTPPRSPLLRSIFGLTPSEAKLADLLAEGHDVKCCAERMRVTEASARFVLKRIFQKTAVKSQSALMRLILSFPCLPTDKPATAKNQR